VKNNRLVIGTRGSQLALWQTEWVKKELERRFSELTIELTIIKTTGDKILDSPLSKIGDKGLFTREIEHALLRGDIDLAVHSLKDIPTETPDGLIIGAITKRADVRDVFISKHYKSLKELPAGATVATGSLRRKAQLLHLRPDLQIADIRGNLNTRFKKFDESTWDGMILARAGIDRLGFSERITQVIPTSLMLPAVGQGALAVEIRKSDRRVRQFVSALQHEATATAVTAERSFLKYLEGGCQIPIGAYGRIRRGELLLDAMVGSLDGSFIIRDAVKGEPKDAKKLGIALAKKLYKQGGKEILEEIRVTNANIKNQIAK
jgi:hydroxymethylbilane synthase